MNRNLTLATNRSNLLFLRHCATTMSDAGASDGAIVLDGDTPGGADGSAPVLSAGGEVLTKSGLKKIEKMKALEAKKAASAAAAEAKAAQAASKPVEESATKKARTLTTMALLWLWTGSRSLEN